MKRLWITGILFISATANADTAALRQTNDEIIDLRVKMGQLEELKSNYRDYVTARDSYLLGESGLLQRRLGFLTLYAEWISAWSVIVESTQWADNTNFDLIQGFVTERFLAQGELFVRLRDSAVQLRETALAGKKRLDSSPAVKTEYLPIPEGMVAEQLQARKELFETFNDNQEFYSSIVKDLADAEPFLHEAFKSRISFNLVNTGARVATEANEIAEAFYKIQLQFLPILAELKQKMQPLQIEVPLDPAHAPGYFEKVDSQVEIVLACERANSAMKSGSSSRENRMASSVSGVRIRATFEEQVMELCQGAEAFFHSYLNQARIPVYSRVFSWAIKRYSAVEPRCAAGDPSINCELVKGLYGFIAFNRPDRSSLKDLSLEELRVYEEGWSRIERSEQSRVPNQKFSSEAQ